MNELSTAEYYTYRAIVEREIADQSSNDLVANIHREMARLYLARSGQSDTARPAMFDPMIMAA